MKKFKPFLLVLATMLLLQNALFAVDYDLYVGGIQVTDANKDNITGSTILSGTVSYDPTSKTLTLNNATIETFEPRGITNNDIAGLTINLIGTNTITVPEDIFRFNKSTTISGDGSLHCIGGDDAITLASSLHLRISNTTLSLELNGSNVDGYADVFSCYTSDTVTITNSTFRVQGQNEFNDAALKFNLSDCAFVAPTGASYSDGALVDGNGNTVSTDPIVIMPNNMEFYVADVYVHALNMDSIAGPSITGHVSFDPVTNTLTLNNATLTPQNFDDGINIDGVENPTIELIGQNSIVSRRDDGISSGPNLTITGDGTLDITAQYGIFFGGGNLSILNTQISFHVVNEPFYASNSFDVLNITNSTVSVDGQVKFSYKLDSLNLVACAIVEPVGASFYDMQIRDSLGEVVVAPILIAPLQPNPIDTTSIYDVAANLSVQLYPNPATTLLNVVAEGFDYVEILNFVGQRLYRAPLTDGTTQLNIATLPAGTYFLRLQGDSVAVKKFTKN